MVMAAWVVSGCGEDAPAPAPDVVEEPGPAVLHLTLTVQLEDWPLQDKSAFLNYVGRIRQYAALAQEHGATFTWEASNLIAAQDLHGDDVLSELHEAGHGIGIHANKGQGATPGAGYGVPDLTLDLQGLRAGLEALDIGARHVSGICSKLDWVTAAADAGFQAATGQTAWCLQSLGATRIPPKYVDCETMTDCEEPWPGEASETVLPWRVSNGVTWDQPTDDGRLVLFHTAGDLACAAERRADSDTSHSGCDFGDDDVDAAVLGLEAALPYAQSERFNTHVIVWRFGTEVPAALLESLLERIDAWVQSGRVRWSTIPRMLDGFIESE